MHRGKSSNDVSRMGDLNLTLYSQEMHNKDDNAVMYFVLAEGTNEATCCTNMSIAYHKCIDTGICSKWITEEECLKITPVPMNVFVLPAFSGKSYDHLLAFYYGTKFEIIGPQCIRMSLESNVDIPIRNKGHPMFTLAMQDIVITMTGFNDEKEEKKELQSLVQKMNGAVTPELSLGTTHIVAGSVLTDKCKLAFSIEKPVMTAEWIKTAWKDSQKDLIQATDAKYVIYSCPIFYKLKICVSQVPSAKKSALKNIIEAHGGVYFNELNRKVVNVLVIPFPGGDKYRYANEWGIPCVTPNWVEMCKSAGHILPFENFSVTGESNNIKSSTPTKTQNPNGFANGTLNTCSIIPYPSKNEVEATFVSTKDESTVNPNPEILSVVKRASDEGPFLDGCKIYMCGSDSQTMEQVRKLLNESGATRLNRLNEHVTHILVIGSKIPEEDNNLLQNLNPRPHLVNIEWLVESARQGSPADEDVYYFDPENEGRVPNSSTKSRKTLRNPFKPSLNIAELVERNSTLKEKRFFNAPPIAPKVLLPLNIADTDVANIQPLHNTADEYVVSNAELKNIGNSKDRQPLNKVIGEECVKIANNLPPLTVETHGEEDLNPNEEGNLTKRTSNSSKRSNGEKSGRVLSQHNSFVLDACPPNDISQATHYSEENDTSDDPVFTGIKFKVNLPVLQEKNDIEDMIVEMNGSIVKEDFDIVILPVVYSKEENIGTNCFTKYWVFDCNEARTTEIPEAKYHHPHPKFKGIRNVLQNVVIAVSQYGNSEKSYLATLAMELGAEYQDVFCRKTSRNAKRSTHLVCSVAENEKCAAANRWSVPIVVSEWIYDCYRNKTMLPVGNYHPSSMKNDSDSMISCLPMTPKTSNSTSNKVAQRLTTVTSVAFYPPSTSKPQVAASNMFVTPKSVRKPLEHTPVSSVSGNDTDLGTQSQTPDRGRRQSKGNDSDIDLAPAKPTEDSPLLWGLSREASRQLKRGFDSACSNSPGPDLSSVMIKIKRGPPDSQLMNSIWTDINKKYSRKPTTPASRLSSNQLPVVRVSMEPKQNVEPIQRQEPYETPPTEKDGIRSKRRKTSDDSNAGDVHKQVPDLELNNVEGEISVQSDLSHNDCACATMDPSRVMENCVVFISKRCENVEVLKDAIENMGGQVSPDLKNPNLTHLIYQGKGAHMSKEVKSVNNLKVKVVDPSWIVNCKEKMTILDENLFRPGKVGGPLILPEKGISTSKSSLDALENLVGLQDVRVSEDSDDACLDTQGKTIKYKKTENRKVLEDSGAEDNYEGEWNNDNAAGCKEDQPRTSKTKKIENTKKTTGEEKSAEKESVDNNEEQEKAKKIFNNVKTSSKESINSKLKSSSGKETEDSTSKPRRVTRSRTVQPVENTTGEETTSKLPKRGLSADKLASNTKNFGPNPVFMISALDQKSLAQETIERLGGSISNETIFDPKADATIAGNLARSEKVLGSIAGGKRLLKQSYITACQHSNKFVSPAEHTWKEEDAKNDLERQVVSAANYWYNRISNNPLDRPYVEYVVFFQSKKSDALCRLVSSGGGTITRDISSANLIVGDAKDAKVPEIAKNIPLKTPTFLSNVLFVPSKA